MPFLNELGLLNIPTGVAIPKVQNAFDANGETKEEAIIKKVDTLVTELKWYAEALNTQRKGSVPPS